MRTIFCSDECNGNCEGCSGSEELRLEVATDVPSGFHEVTVKDLMRRGDRLPRRARRRRFVASA